jgi:hypothetical protein
VTCYNLQVSRPGDSERKRDPSLFEFALLIWINMISFILLHIYIYFIPNYK